MSRQMLRSARVISALTLVSRVLGLARDMAISNAFGVGSAASAFWIMKGGRSIPRRIQGLTVTVSHVLPSMNPGTYGWMRN